MSGERKLAWILSEYTITLDRYLQLLEFVSQHSKSKEVSHIYIPK